PDGGQHAQRLRRAEERPQAGGVPASRRRGDPARHLGADDLPGVGHADRPEVRGLLAGRGRQPAQGVRQEDPRADRQGAREGRRRLGDHTLARREACGNKVRELIAKEPEKFVAGCETTGYGAELGNKWFDIIEPFADYAFNKSHSFGYGYAASPAAD